jgi:hypothetical protein
MTVYHGTTLRAARSLAASPCPVSVTRGGGELGQGFYTGESIALAASWARGRFGARSSATLEITIDNSMYVKLNILTLSGLRVVSTWNQLQTSGTTRSHRFGYDVVYGPLATYPHAAQHKFESAAAEHTLKSASWKIL